MKKNLQYIKKHLSTFVTLIITIVIDIILNVNPNIQLTLAENVFLAGLIGLNLSFLFDFTRNLDSVEDKLDDLAKTFPETLIETYPSVDLIAEELKTMVSIGPHQVDIVFYDIAVRTSDPKKVNKMRDFVKYCADNSRIKLRLAFVPTKDSICQRINNIIDSEKKHSNSFYAYQESTITFASFMIIDSKYVSIRTPHKNGSRSLYCVVLEEDLCDLYSSWFNILWDEAIHVSSTNLREFIEKYKDLIPDKERDTLLKRLPEIRA